MTYSHLGDIVKTTASPMPSFFRSFPLEMSNPHGGRNLERLVHLVVVNDDSDLGKGFQRKLNICLVDP